jgi:hypothetical protein
LFEQERTGNGAKNPVSSFLLQETAPIIYRRLEALDCCKALNPATPAPGVVWRALAPGRNAKEICGQVVEGRLPADKSAHFATEVPRLFERQRQAS